ncbi:apolipoprotein N-acyltransferase [Fulvivirga sediminis]|uniref:Apolipoprotein N-acyltransferase n=1 Tax=Fulvivirga sediminis TaxID=2803949 RepID=A0A937F9H6_9BACT|nr:apolipoprotein N-acyltransferase [Fulvivirga sediminis]MBL3657706.1 apolipoprotein N-acyltransferase [Fulvivirga sediminis]
MMRNIGLAILSGILLIIAWPPIGLTPLLFVAMVPLLYVLYDLSSIKKAFLYIYMAFFLWSLGTMYWIANTRLDSSGFAVVLAAFILIPLFQALPMLLLVGVRKVFKSYQLWLFLPMIWCSYEYLHSKWELAFTWLHLGFGLGSMPFLAQFYELTGYLGGSVLVILINVLVLFLIKEAEYRKRWSIILAGTFVAILTLNFILYNSEGKGRGTAKVAVVQPNEDSYQIVNQESLHRKVEAIKSDLLTLKGKGVELVVYPEGYIRTTPNYPFIINNPESTELVQSIRSAAEEADLAVLIGFVGFRVFPEGAAPSSAVAVGNGSYASGYNAAMLIAPETPAQIQVKNNLVPFMERVPFLDWTSYFETLRLNLNQAKASYTPDDRTKVFRYKNLRIAPLICLDALFPDYIRSFKAGTPNLIAIIANDGWAGKTSGFGQNADYAATSAISFRKEVVRSASTGISLTLDERGSVKNSIPWNKSDIIIENVTLKNGDTLYEIFGSYIGVVAVMITFGLFIAFFLKARKM